MIPKHTTPDALPVRSFYCDGYIFTIYKVLVPDPTVSGDFRHEFVSTRQLAKAE